MKETFRIGLLFSLMYIRLAYGWDEVFKFASCYEKSFDQRMPISIDNLIAIVENYERDNSNTNPQNIANAILYRYRTNGITFSPASKVGEWSVSQYEENHKQDLDDKLLKPSITIPQDSLSPREECSLQLMMSHSTDFYPHAGVDYVWDNNNYYPRKKRSFSGISPYSLPQNLQPADHPIEFGIIETSAGPVAGGLMFAGILASSSTRSYTVGELISSDSSDKMPPEMLTKKIEPLYGATISGELAQAAILAKKAAFSVGPIGMFGNCSACPRLFTLQNDKFSYLSRAEIFGALDGLIIGKYLQQTSSSQSILLSQILRMYYGNHGLFNHDIRACNRKNIYNKFQGSINTKISEQALNYMYAFQRYIPDMATPVEQYSNDFAAITATFTEFLNPVVTAFNSLMSSYSYDDPGYYPCPKSVLNDVQYETQVDLVVVYTPTGATSEIQNQQQYIGLTARKIGVGYHRSRIAVLNGRTEKWLSPMRNYSNIADYVCNYTTFTEMSGSSQQDFLAIMDKLTKFYFGIYSYLRKDPDRIDRNSQIVLWNLPTTFEGNTVDIQRAWYNFNMTYPDVSFIFAGSKNTPIQPLYEYNKNELIFLSTSSLNAAEIANQIFIETQKAPRMFLYAACDTLISEYSTYNEGDHIYTNYVSPNYTTLIRIPPQNFHFSERVQLTIKSNNARVCVSRINHQPSDSDTTQTSCGDAPFTYEQKYLCDRYLDQCDAIYLSVTGKADKTQYCSDESCVYPNQIEFQMTHEGMVCAGCQFRPTHFVLMSLVIFILMRT